MMFMFLDNITCELDHVNLVSPVLMRDRSVILYIDELWFTYMGVFL